MIFYFSATGNSQYVADRIVAATGELSYSIVDCMSFGQFDFETDDNAVGFVVPTYAWGLPGLVSDFLENFSVIGQNKLRFYLVVTYGTTPGHSGYFAEQILRKKGYAVTALFSVKMPDTWTPTYDLSDQNRVAKINRAAENEIDFVIDALKKEKRGDFMRNKVPRFTKVFCKSMYDRMRRTKYFRVEDTCIGCGLCEKRCPVGAISMRNHKPVWTKDQCVMCLGCLHRCPRFAIQYGKNTKKHGQYRHPGMKQ